jgi:hypothetical protein
MRLGAWAALFALTVQLVLSFGHVHFAGTDPQSASAPLALRWAFAPPSPDAPAVPAQPKPIGLADDFCAICSATQLVGVPAATPSLPLPIAVGYIAFDASAEFAAVASPPGLFQARAPPQA